MIPFSIFQSRFYDVDSNREEVRALELSPGGFTFRLALSALLKPEKLQMVEVRFVHVHTGEACLIRLSEFEIIPIKSTDYYRIFRLETSDAAFGEEALRLSREYLDYIDAKLYLEDAALSKQYYPEYPADKEAAFLQGEPEPREAGVSGFSHVRASAAEASISSDFDQPDLGIILRTPADRTHYLNAASANYLPEYIQLKQIPDHLLKVGLLQYHYAENAIYPLRYRNAGDSFCPLRYLYVGDSFCPLLFPSSEECQKLILKAKANRLYLVFLLAPVSESLLDEMCDRLSQLAAQLEQMDYRAELETGDIGMLHFCETLSPRLQASLGILPRKKTKDPRKQYFTDVADDFPEYSRKSPSLPDCLDTTEHAIYLPDCLDITEHAIYLPYYQTNTATFCTLQAVLETGSRSQTRRITHCSTACERAMFLYPEHLQMLGRGNSLFGFCRESLDNPLQINRETGKRIVFNF